MKNKIIAITSYPARGKTHGEQVVGIASYAKNTFRAILGAASLDSEIDGESRRAGVEKNKLSIEVLAEKLDAENDYTERGIQVKRLWKRNSFTAFPTLLREILKTTNNDSKTVLIEFELAMFGNLLYILPFPIFLAVLKLMGKRIIFVMHQVIDDLEDIAPHINLSQRSFTTDLMDVVLKLFYSYILFIATKVIVFEEGLKESLSARGETRKIVVIPHGVEEFKNIPGRIEARKKLGVKNNSFVILSFGFLAWYKGTDWLVHAINDIKKKNKGRDIALVLAGGPNPNHTDKNYYQRYIKGIMNESKKNGFMVTGFVKERDIPMYFKAADLVVFPYRTFMSSSGPLSIALSFKKPFLLSPKLRDVLMADDMKEMLNEAHLKIDNLVFEDFNGDFANKLSKIRTNSKLMGKIVKFAAFARRARAWEKIGKKYYEEIVN